MRWEEFCSMYFLQTFKPKFNKSYNRDTETGFPFCIFPYFLNYSNSDA